MYLWIQINAISLLNSVGLICDIFGAFFVASEVVRQFKGIKHKQSTGYSFGDFVSNSPPEETEEYKQWDLRKYRNMKIGLGFLVFGFGLQVVANILQFKNAA